MGANGSCGNAKFLRARFSFWDFPDFRVAGSPLVCSSESYVLDWSTAFLGQNNQKTPTFELVGRSSSCMRKRTAAIADFPMATDKIL
jgi:hypothetical protein